MADVVEAFARGRSQAQAEEAHTVALKGSKLQQQILKHQIDTLKLDDQLREQELTKGRADLGLLSGEGGATPDVTKPATADLQPSQVGGIRGLFLKQEIERLHAQAPAAPDSAAAPPADGTPTPAAGQIVAPVDSATHPPLVLHTNDAVPPTHAPNGATPPTFSAYGDPTHPEMKQAGHVWIPGLNVPELGIQVPGMWYSAKAAAEESSRRAIALKRAEMPFHNVGPEETAIDGAGNQVFTNTTSRGNTPQEKYIAALQRGDTATARIILQGIKDTQRPGAAGSLDAMLLEARRKGDTASANLIAGVMRDAANLRRDPDAADARLVTQQRQMWTEDVANGFRKHGDDLKAWIAKYPAGKIDDTVPDPPEYEAPTFSEWQKTHGTDLAAAKGARAASTAAAKGTAPAAADNGAKPAAGTAPTLPRDTVVGDYVTQNGKRFRVKSLQGEQVALEPAVGPIKAGDVVHYNGARYKVASVVNGQAKLEPVTAAK